MSLLYSRRRLKRLRIDLHHTRSQVGLIRDPTGLPQ